MSSLCVSKTCSLILIIKQIRKILCFSGIKWQKSIPRFKKSLPSLLFSTITFITRGTRHSVAGREVKKYWTERKQRWQVTFPITHPAQHLWGDLHDCDDCVSLGVSLCVTQWQRRTRDSERKGERRERLNCRAQKRMWAYVTARASAHVCEFVYACSPRAGQDKLGWVSSPGVIAVCVRMTRTFLLFFKPNPSFLSLHVSPSPFSPPLSVCALKKHEHTKFTSRQ